MANRQQTSSTFSGLKPWIMWGLGAGFFFAEYFARVDPSVIVPELMRAFHANAETVGNLSSFFYYPYIFMQIPVGTLVDRFGLRKLLTSAAALCALASFLFAISHSFWLAAASRALIGFAAAFAFVGTLKLVTLWFPPSRLGLMAGLTQGMGMLGAAVGQGLFAVIIVAIGWRSTMIMIGGILLLIAMLMSMLVRDQGRYQPTSVGNETNQLSVLQSFLVAARNPYTWVTALYAGLLYAPTGTFGELWGPSFFERSYHFSSELAAMLIATIFIGFAIGGPLFGKLSDRIGRRKPVMIVSSLMSFIFLSIVIYVPHLNTVLLFILLLCYGFSNTGVALAYAVAGELNPLAVSGISIAITNMASILIAAIAQPFVGWMLDRHWSGRYVHGIPFYTAADYHAAVIGLPLFLLAALILICFVKETYCRRESD